MVSILIPTYNYNVYPLVKKLENQAVKAKIIFEIICIDDGSLSPLNIENEKINTLQYSKFIALKKNVGLSETRNILANSSKYEYLLFIDGDSILIDHTFVKRYLNHLKNKPDVIYGGRVHPHSVSPNRKLRWKYGKFREDLSAIKRNRNKYKTVLFNNTIIKKTVFNKIGFEKTITQYGHEDTVFSYQLSMIKASVIHIDNPVLHGDVDLNQVYLFKTKKALENLNLIYTTGMIDPHFITFLRFFKTLKKWKLNYFLSMTYMVFQHLFVINLTSKNPSLYVFDLFRLSYFCYINLKK